MEMTVSCGVCSKIIAVVDKPVITSSDQTMYQQMSSCDVDGQADIQVVVTG